MLPAPATAWLEDWARTWDVPDLPRQLRIETSTRLRRSLGRCRPASGRILLHPALIHHVNDGAPSNTGHDALLREVLCHEAAHVAVHLLHGSSARPHGPEWAGLMRAAGYEPRVKLDPAALPADFRKATEPRVLYQHHCPICGMTRIARRPVRRWRCRACHEAGLGGRLEITTRPLTEVGHR